jgi:putative transcriptional regulator
VERQVRRGPFPRAQVPFCMMPQGRGVREELRQCRIMPPVMAKRATKRDLAREILEGLRQLKRGEIGRVINVPSVTAVRERTGLSQEKFATLLGVSVRTLQEWEQGRRAPSGAARTLLRVAARNPRALLEVA